MPRRHLPALALAAVLACGPALAGAGAPAAATGAADPAATASTTASEASTGTTASTTAPAAGDGPELTGRVVVRYAPGTGATEKAASTRRVEAQRGVDLAPAHPGGNGTEVLEGARPREAGEVAAALADEPGVVSAEPDYRVRATASDPYLSRQWGLGAPGTNRGAANVTPAWDASTGAGEIVAVVDSGITNHPDLAGRTVPGYDLVSDTAWSRDGDERDPDPADPGDWVAAGECGDDNPAEDSSWHGTHVAGIVAATSGNGVGGAGVAPGARVMPVRGLGACGGSLADIADGITWASGGSVTGLPRTSTPAGVVNLSLGGEAPCTSYMQRAVDGALARGTTVVAAAGNEAVDASSYAPANCRGVVTVGAVGRSGSRASYSNYGASVTLAAPGGDGRDSAGWILSTINGGTRGPGAATYGAMMGTSQAAPHVSGVVALVRAAAPGLTPAATRSLLTRSVRPFPRAQSPSLGAGLLDASAAVAAARALAAPAPTTATPSRVAGGDRIATAIAASRRWWSASDTVYLASSAAFPDALSAGPAAARDGAPLLLTPPADAPSAILDEIARLGARRVVVVGGAGAVSPAVEPRLRALGASVTRIGGGDRYATSALVARTFPSASRVFLAGGTAFADATSAGAAAAVTGSPLLLTAPGSLPPVTRDALDALGASRVDVVGGPAVVAPAVATALAPRAVTRIGGRDRYETSVLVSRAVASPGRSVVLASGENWPDALVGGPVAGKSGAMELLTPRTCLPATTATEIARLDPPTVTFLGGTASVADDVLSRRCG